MEKPSAASGCWNGDFHYGETVLISVNRKDKEELIEVAALEQMDLDLATENTHVN